MDSGRRGTINIVVLMAGRGSRFTGSAPDPKPMIEVSPGKRMVELAIDYLTPPDTHRFIFVCLAEHDRKFGYEQFFASRTADHRLVLTDTVTSGPAASALLAERFISDDDELLIAYSDCYLEIDIADFLARNRNANSDGGVVTYPSSGPVDCYVELDSSGMVRRAAEKQRISGTASSSLFYFRRGREFVQAARSMVGIDQQTSVESFVGPVFNGLIAEGKKVLAYPISRAQRIEMGTPEDLSVAQRWLQEHDRSSAVETTNVQA